MSSQNKKCYTCDEIHTNEFKWCDQCHINYFRERFTNWTSGNEKIDNFIQEMRLKIDKYDDIIFEWIPYNQFSDIKEIGKCGFATVYSATWKNGPLNYNKDIKKYGSS